MKFPKLSRDQAKIWRWLRFGAVAGTLLVSALAVIVLWPQPSVSIAASSHYPTELRVQYASVVKAVRDYQGRQRSLNLQAVSPDEISRQLSVVQLDASSGHYLTALNDIKALRQTVANWNLELSGGSKAASIPASTPGTEVSAVNLPILLYHYPPPNFEAQLIHLEQRGYTVISLDEAVVGLRGGPLPPKPVIITFDDGFAAQTSAVDLLVKHNMKATFYIITGGEASKWCIGAGRRYADPLQPPGGCGDAYLTWDQVRAIDQNPLFTIGGHTVNHRNLATLSVDEQRFEIQNGKAQIEAQLGHPVNHFCYPYGAFTGTSIELAKEAGYVTATTTQPGTVQPAGSAFTLRRERDALTLQ